MNKRKITFKHYSCTATLKITHGMINKIFNFKTFDDYIKAVSRYYVVYKCWYCRYKQCILYERKHKWVKKL